MRAVRLLFGAFLGLVLVAALWFGDFVEPPEGLTRRVAAFAAVYPGPVAEAEVERIECRALPRLRFYLVCTRNCEQVRRLLLVKGLQASLLANLGRTPPEPVAITRRRINAAVGGERLRIDAAEAGTLIGCYLRLEGLHPALVLPEGGYEAVEAARPEGEDALRHVAEGFDVPGAESRIHVQETTRGFEADMLYWDTWRTGLPVLQLHIDLARDGQVRDLRAVQLAAPAGRATGTP